MLTKNKKKIKLVDFGTAWDTQNPSMKGAGNGSTGRKVFDHFVGTPHYMPVELIRNKGSFLKTDIYSLGCILYQFVSGYQPFLGGSEYLIFQQSVEGELRFYDFFEDEVVDLIGKMMEKDWEARIGVDEVIRHPWFDLYRARVGELSEHVGTDFEQFWTAEERFLEQVSVLNPDPGL